MIKDTETFLHKPVTHWNDCILPVVSVHEKKEKLPCLQAKHSLQEIHTISFKRCKSLFNLYF